MRHAGAAVRANQRASQPHIGAIHTRTIRTTTIPSPRLTHVADPPAPARPAAVAASRRQRRPSRLFGIRADHLEHILIAGDGVAVLFGFYLVIFSVAAIGPSSWKELLAQAIAVTTLGMVAIRSQKLWVSRLNSVRAIELSRITRAVGLMGLGTIVLDRGLHLYFHVAEIADRLRDRVARPRRLALRSIARGSVGSARPAASRGG